MNLVNRKWRAKRVALRSCAQVMQGFADRGAAAADGEVRLLQARDVDAAGVIRWDLLDRRDRSAGTDRSSLRHEDVLLTIRTTAPRAMLVEAPPVLTSASGQFAIVRCEPDQLDPRFLVWCLNAPSTVARLRAAFRGSSMPFLAVKDLAEFEIDLPALERQRAIVRVQELCLRLADLDARLHRCVGTILEAVSRRAPAR